MGQNTELMSQKEKDYIAFCFNRSFNSLKTDVDYGLVLAGEKIEYDLKQDKREIKTIFGKHFKRSRKCLRVSANTQTSFLADELLVSQFLEIFTILKYVVLDAQSSAEIEGNIVSYFDEYFGVLGNSPKVYALLSDALGILSAASQVELMRSFFVNCNKVRDADALFEFLDKCLAKLPASDSFIHDGLWKSSAGCLLGLFLILKDQKHLTKIFDSFISSEVVECKYLHEFTGILETLCSDQQKDKIKKKVAKAKGADIQHGFKSLSLDK